MTTLNARQLKRQRYLARRQERAELEHTVALLPDAALAARIAELEAVTAAAEMPEDDLTEAGHAELYALIEERDRRNYSGPWEVASGTSEGGAAAETSPSYRAAMQDAGRGHLLGD